RLRAVKVMNGRMDVLARFLVRTYRMDQMPHHLQRLKRHHGFVVFGVIAHQHEDLFRGHRRSSCWDRSAEISLVPAQERSQANQMPILSSTSPTDRKRHV